MSADLSTLLEDAAPTPREPVDVDAVLRRGRQLGRRRVALQSAFAVVAVLAIAGVSSLLVDAPQQPFVDEGPAATTPTAVAGTYADGAVVISEPGQSPTLDLDIDARLSGEPFAELQMVPTELAVATDGAVGVLDEATLRVLRDGEEITRTDLPVVLSDLADRPATTDVPSTADQIQERDLSMAFDSEGTLWLSVAGPGGAVVGLHRDGEVTATAGPQQEDQELRVVGDAVSVLTYTDPAFGQTPAQATITPVTGEDPRVGAHSIPTVPGPTMVYRGTHISDHQIAITSIFGAGRVDLANAPNSAELEIPRSATSIWGTARVADTAAGLVARTRLDPAVLIVQRPGGIVVGALLDDEVDPETEQRLSISPNGAVHLASATQDGGMVVSTLLQADLSPAGTDGDRAEATAANPELPEGEYVDLSFEAVQAVVPWHLPEPVVDGTELRWDGRASVVRRAAGEDSDHFAVHFELQQPQSDQAQDLAGHGRGIIRVIYVRATRPEPGRGPSNATLDDGTPAWIDTGSVDFFKDPLYVQMDGEVEEADLLDLANSIADQIEQTDPDGT